MRIARLMGADYGRVLAIADQLDAGWSVRDILDPLARNVHDAWLLEKMRREHASAQ
jgi:hypothetical protein